VFHYVLLRPLILNRSYLLTYLLTYLHCCTNGGVPLFCSAYNFLGLPAARRQSPRSAVLNIVLSDRDFL